jgi:hypothetical protein
MASGFYNQGLLDIANGTIDLDTTTLKIMLVDNTYVYNPDHTVVDNGANDTSDPSYCEISATNYTGGYGGGGRKTATITGQVNNTSNRADFAIADLTWTALGGATNDTVGGAILVRETGGADTSARLVAFFDLTDTPTNGSDILLDFTALASGGNIRFAA